MLYVPPGHPERPGAPRCRPHPLRGLERNGNAVTCTFASPKSRLAGVTLSQLLLGDAETPGHDHEVVRVGGGMRPDHCTVASIIWASVEPFESSPPA
jgi:hypothetical protein